MLHFRNRGFKFFKIKKSSKRILRFNRIKENENEKFINLISKNLLVDLSVCFVILSLVFGIIFGILNLNGIDNSNVLQKPNYTEYWIQQCLSSIAFAAFNIAVLIKKDNLRNYFLRETVSFFKHLNRIQPMAHILEWHHTFYCV